MKLWWKAAGSGEQMKLKARTVPGTGNLHLSHTTDLPWLDKSQSTWQWPRRGLVPTQSSKYYNGYLADKAQVKVNHRKWVHTDMNFDTESSNCTDRAKTHKCRPRRLRKHRERESNSYRQTRSSRKKREHKSLQC